jgi:desulfoferrodoxin-like iron-binding protein
MAVEKVGERYRCNVCGNEVVVTAVGGGTLVCCGEDMEKISNPENQARNLPPDG